tara:strand:- start:7434 stop:8510 length:1077 start_codon:yes stop_codon:yes gene_type:complete
MSSSGTSNAKVSASEFDLLSIVRAIISGEGSSVAWLLRRDQVMQPELSPQAHALVQEMLGKGVMLKLCQWGGWRKSRSLRGNEVVSGRLWERHQNLSLRYSDYSLQLLVALTRESLEGTGGLIFRVPSKGPPEIGDQLLACLALDAARGSSCAEVVARAKPIRAAPLCWLMHADLLGRVGMPPAKIDFDCLLSGPGAIVLEALGDQLARRWLAMELGKGKVRNMTDMQGIGLGQSRTLECFLSAIARAGREDLALFVVTAASQLHRRRLVAQDVTSSLQKHKSMRERSDAMIGAAAFLDALTPLAGWAQGKRSLRFFDDDYEAGQVFLEGWSTLGNLAFEELQSLAAELRSFSALEDS